MSRTSSAAVVAALALTVTSLAGAQQPAGDTATHHPKPSTTPDQRQDRRAISADSARLQHDIAIRDSLRTRVANVRDRFSTDIARADSAKAKLDRDRQVKPPEPAAVRQDMADLKRARNTYDQDLDRFKHDRTQLVKVEQRVDAQVDAETAARKDLRADRRTAFEPRDLRQDAHQVSADSAKLQHDIALRDSTRTLLTRDRARTRTEEAKLDSLQTALSKARKTSPADTAAIQASIARARKTLESDQDRDQHERAQVASIDHRISKDADATSDARHDQRSDRSALEHPAIQRATAKSHRP
jgi:hypothetical protein